MKNMLILFKRELMGYFETPVAYVFIVVFLLLSGIFTFYVGKFYDSGQADLTSFFMWHPWLYIFLMPALAMRLWSEEFRLGTIELIMTLPIKPWQAVIGKYLAAWAFAAIALVFTFPLWITVCYLGKPDNIAIFSGYIGSLLVSGGMLAIGSCMSSLTRNQVVAFVLAATVCFLFTLSGFPLVLDFFTSLGLPQVMVDTISSFGFITHFDKMYKGLIGLDNLVFYTSLISLCLFLNIVIVNTRRA